MTSFAAFLVSLLSILLSFVDCGDGEQWSMKFAIDNRDQHVIASLVNGNETGRLLKNVSLHLVIDAVVDTSDKPIGATELVRDTKRNNAAALSTFEEVLKEEEFAACTKSLSSMNQQIERKNLRITRKEAENSRLRLLMKEMNNIVRFFCPERAKQMPKIYPKSEFGEVIHVDRQIRTKEADLLIVNGHFYAYKSRDYTDYIHALEYHEGKYFGDLRCNFWISEDGEVYEGIGWDQYNYARNGGLGPISLIIAFLKKERETPPSAAAIMSFQKLVTTAICSKKLAHNYSIIPYYLIQDLHSLSDNSFERSGMRNWERYKDNLDFLFPAKSNETRILPIISRLEWSGAKSKQDLRSISSPIEYIVFRHFALRCFVNCSNDMKVLERELNITYGHMHSNFILTEDGRAYEGEGWEKTWEPFYQEKKAVVTAFFGKFHSYLPNKNIFTAFNSVIHEGMRLGKLSQSYKIVSIKAADPQSPHISDNLEEEVKKLYSDRYRDKF